MASGTPATGLVLLERIIATLDEVAHLDAISDVTRRIARGFVEMGAVMSILVVHDGDHFRVAGRWPEEAADGLFERVKGGALMDFTIPLDDADNPYVQVFTRQEPRVITGSERVVDSVMRTYAAGPEQRQTILAALTGESSVLLPLVARGRSVGVAALNYVVAPTETELHLFNIFAGSAATLLSFKRDVVGKQAILAELRAALAKEQRTREELNRTERLAALGEMAAVVAHEIRNPLAVISNSVTALQRHLDASDEARLLVGITGEETRRISRIIDDMLSFSLPIDTRGEPVAIPEVVAQALHDLEERGGHPGVQVQVDCPSELPQVRMVARQITQAIVSLLKNAIEAAGERGVVTVRCDAGGSDAPAGFVRIAVSDHGAGIAPEHLAQIYKPFFTTRATGTGLGLSIVKRTVDAHGGRIDVQTKVGEGTTVVLDLPMWVEM